MTEQSSWRALAEKQWGQKAAWVRGDGPFALLTSCRVLTVTLYTTREEAEREKEVLDEAACGSMCDPALHAIVDLTRPK